MTSARPRLACRHREVFAVSTEPFYFLCLLCPQFSFLRTSSLLISLVIKICGARTKCVGVMQAGDQSGLIKHTLVNRIVIIVCHHLNHPELMRA